MFPAPESCDSSRYLLKVLQLQPIPSDRHLIIANDNVGIPTSDVFLVRARDAIVNGMDINRDMALPNTIVIAILIYMVVGMNISEFSIAVSCWVDLRGKSSDPLVMLASSQVVVMEQPQAVELGARFIFVPKLVCDFLKALIEGR